MPTIDDAKPSVSLESYIAGFDEEPGYLDFGHVGPVGSTVIAEQDAVMKVLARARPGSLDGLIRQDERVRTAISALIRFPSDQIVFQPNTSTGLMQAMGGLTGDVLLSPRELPSVSFAEARVGQALGTLNPLWLQTEHGCVTPSNVRAQLTPATVAVAVSLVDSRTGYVTDLEALRHVIGDRVLIVDAIQGLGVVDAPFELADIVVSGGQKWVRAGWGTGFLALSERALARTGSVFSGPIGSEGPEPWDEATPLRKTADAFRVARPDPLAQARFAAALEEIAAVGVPAINTAVAERVSAIVDIADEFGLAVVSSRNEQERAGMVVVQPAPEEMEPLTTSLLNHGVTARIRPRTVRFSAHASTSDQTLAALRAAFISAASATSY